MPHCMELGLIPGDVVLDRDPALPSQKEGRAPSPIFGPFLLWSNVCMHQDATWYGGRPHAILDLQTQNSSAAPECQVVEWVVAWVLLQISYTLSAVLKFENRLRCDKVTESIKVETFLGHMQCSVHWLPVYLRIDYKLIY